MAITPAVNFDEAHSSEHKISLQRATKTVLKGCQFVSEFLLYSDRCAAIIGMQVCCRCSVKSIRPSKDRTLTLPVYLKHHLNAPVYWLCCVCYHSPQQFDDIWPYNEQRRQVIQDKILNFVFNILFLGSFTKGAKPIDCRYLIHN